MKKHIFYAVLVVLTINCSSVQKHNALIKTDLSVENQLDDINYLEQKMIKVQPSLYNFISKEDLRRKFDSVRSTINIPLKPNEFYFKVSPLLASIRQGHAAIGQLIKKKTKEEKKELKKKSKIGPLSQFDYKWKDNKLLILKNYSKDSLIQVGTEVVSVENIKPQELFNKYRKTYTSDGYNETFIPYAFSMRFGTYMFYELGLNDSLNFNLKYKDSVYSKMVKRFPKKDEKLDKTKKDSTSVEKKKDSVIKKLTKEEKKIAKKKKKAEDNYKYDYGYDAMKKEYSKTLRFTDIDSCTAIFKIKNFSKGGYKVAYKEVFELLRKTDTKNLVLDLRGNPGGRLDEIHNLYSYLTADSTYQFIEKPIVASKTSMLKADYLSVMPKFLYPILIPTYPIYAIPLLLKTKKDKNGAYRFSIKSSKVKQHNANYFKGKIYVLINGGSFSAACILPSKLKENSAITFVGEETGGVFNGTVAGRKSSYKLPNSKLPTVLWLEEFISTNKTDIIGRGIFPDKEVIPTLEDIMNENDPELEWIENDIASKK